MSKVPRKFSRREKLEEKGGPFESFYLDLRECIDSQRPGIRGRQLRAKRSTTRRLYDDDEVRSAAGQALKSPFRQEIIDRLVDCLELWHCYPRFVVPAIKGLGRLKEHAASQPGILDRLLSMFDRMVYDGYVGENAVSALRSMGEEAGKQPGFVPKLCHLLRFGSKWQKINAAWTLGAMGPLAVNQGEAIPLLLENLATDDLWLCTRAVESLGELVPSGADSTVISRELLACLENANWQTKSSETLKGRLFSPRQSAAKVLESLDL